MRKINKQKGILFWITGLSGSGKSTMGKKIHKRINNLYGPTIMISGDNVRKIFGLKGHTKTQRLNITKKYCNFAKYITDQKINLIFAVVAMFDQPRNWNRKNIKNYIEIYIKSNLKKIINQNKKKIYHTKKIKNIVGIDIKPEFPRRPDIVIQNNFKLTTEELSKKVIKKSQSIVVNR